MEKFELHRANKLIESSIDKLKLDLSNYTVLTEVGSHNYLYLPILAAKANSIQVFAWAKDSVYGQAEEIILDCKKLMKHFGIKNELIEFSANTQPIDQIKHADIITNSFALRPLNEALLKHTKSNCVIPLMFEKWEFRNADIDLNYCKQKGLRVAGTWENHPELGIFNAVGNLAQKMTYEAGLEIWQNNIFVWSSDSFGKVISESFSKSGAKLVKNSADINEFEKIISILDILFICDYHENKSYFSIEENSIFDIQKIIAINPSLTIIHLFGKIDIKILQEYSVNVFPKKDGQSEIMSHTLGHLGLKTIIDLQAASLKVGEALLKNDISNSLLQML